MQMEMGEGETATGRAGGGGAPHQVTLIAMMNLQPTSLKERIWAEGGDGAKESKHIII